MFSQKNYVDFTTLAQLISKLGDLLFKYDLVTDSRQVNANSIFCAYPGLTTDGREYIDKAINMGAKAIIYEDDGNNNKIQNDSILHISVKNLMHYVGLLASEKYNNPSKKFMTIGVTGTNGKTSITNWLNQSYANFGKKTAIIGTIGAGIYPKIQDYSYTTPDPITLQHLLDNFAQQKIDLLAMEVSSHALDQGRVNGIAFDTAIFTNLTQDHLDYHCTMEAYYKAKSNLFYWQGLENVIINTDDYYGKCLVNELKTSKQKLELNVITYGIISPFIINQELQSQDENQQLLNDEASSAVTNESQQSKCSSLYASDIKITLGGMQFKLHYQNEVIEINVKVIGKFNVYNLLAVSACLLTDGYKLSQIAEVLAKLTPVCGRMDTIRLANKPLVVIDYAHTPDALENTLNTLRDIEHSGKLYCVFGCGGNRDTTKRPKMGEIASSISDYVYITSDNPRNEPPEEIIRQIIVGVDKSNYETIVHRDDAIEKAINSATSDDIILIAGKGHETYQEINGVKNHFSDFEIASSILESEL
jgi:UDP-N-acetylmuramoyl-L-alanyl-D-glutamate--2,6-diaminopimelate ligase